MSAEGGFSVLFKDEHLVVVLKEAGLLTTPAHDGRPCLVDQLEVFLDKERFARHRLAVVHRLDRDTSGLLVFSRSPKITPLLAKQFAAHRVEREYLAVLSGLADASSGTLNTKLDGKRAITHFTVISRNDQNTTVTVRLETGRTNQIRKHFAAIGHPLLGDARFGNDAPQNWTFPGIALHARTLGFMHPVTKMMQRFQAPNPLWYFQYLSNKISCI